MSEVILITDGSADNRNGSGGWCAILRSGSRLVELCGYAENTTSNRMELTAAIEGLKACTEPSEVTVVTDSNYLLETFKYRRYEKWLKEKRTTPRKNMDLWTQLIGLAAFHDITYVKVKGHSGDYWNTRADRLADNARRNKVDERYEISDWNDTRCSDISPADIQCKLHSGHGGIHLWSNGRANGVAPYIGGGTLVSRPGVS